MPAAVSAGTGTRLRVYEVTAKIGEGGMGEVYRPGYQAQPDPHESWPGTKRPICCDVGKSVEPTDRVMIARVRPMNNDALLTMNEVCGYLRVETRTVYRLIHAGRIPAIRVGNLWRFRKSDIDAWLESPQPVRTAAEPRAQAPAGSVAPAPASSRPRVT